MGTFNPKAAQRAAPETPDGRSDEMRARAGSMIAAKRGRVLASAELGNGPGVVACWALQTTKRRQRATLSFIF